MKADNSLFQTLSQLRSQQLSRQYQLMEQKKTAIGNGQQSPVNKPNNGQSKPTTPTTPTAPTEPAKKPTKLDFQQMTRGQLSDWFNQAVANGKISKDQQTAFRVMLFNGQGSDSEQAKADTTVLDFTEKAKAGLQSALKRKDQSSIEFWAKALTVMKKFQGQPVATTAPQPSPSPSPAKPVPIQPQPTAPAKDVRQS
jgi:hypothetical protein